ncbi:MAG: hypothetical protein PHW25_16440 [Zoogloea sp.]|nr:hypothetical protein [Zoogloea sp.]MDD3328676.1 hypothetical protein [Zoogloea sp.]
MPRRPHLPAPFDKPLGGAPSEIPDAVRPPEPDPLAWRLAQ